MRSDAHYNPSPPETGILCTSSNNYDHIYYPHFHVEYEISIVLSGVHLLELENETYRLLPGNLVMLRPNEVHTRSMEVPGKYMAIVLPAREVCRMVRYLGDEIPTQTIWGPRPPVIKLSPVAMEQYIRRIEQINLSCVSNPPRALFEIRALLVDLCTQYYHNPDITTPVRTPWFTKLVQDMSRPENIRRGLPAMLEMAPYSHEYLCREFKRMLGCTPTEFINNARLDYAHKLLENPQTNIVDICYAVGFDSVSYFYRLFKSKFGNTPSRYRKLRFISSPGIPPEQAAGTEQE